MPPDTSPGPCQAYPDADGVLNLLPTHMVISLTGAIGKEHESRRGGLGDAQSRC